MPRLAKLLLQRRVGVHQRGQAPVVLIGQLVSLVSENSPMSCELSHDIRRWIQPFIFFWCCFGLQPALEVGLQPALDFLVGQVLVIHLQFNG